MIDMSQNMDIICPHYFEQENHLYMKIVPMRDLKDTKKIEQLCSESKEPIFVTKNGYGKLVVMDIEYFEQYFQMILDLDSENIIQGLKDLQDNKTYDGIKVLKDIRTKYGIK